MKKMNIRLFKPSIGDDELASIKDSFDSSWIGLGPKVAEFEQKWANHVDTKYAIALNSATAALHLGLMLFNFPQKKKVLVPSLTFSSTASAILYNNLIPVFVDSREDTLGMCLEDLDLKYDKDCVAVMPVHYSGHPIEMEKLIPWAKKRNLKVIEDCAHTTGSLYKGKRLGTWGDIGCYSFEEKKLMTTGDGGMIVTNCEELFVNIKAMRWVGIDKDNWKTSQEYTASNKDSMHWFYELNILGYKYNMNDLAASIGLVQLDKLDLMNHKRSKIIHKYLKGIEKCKYIKPLLPYNPNHFVYQMFGIRTNNKEDLILFLKNRGIATGCHYTPLHTQPLFKKYTSSCKITEKVYSEMITLPLHVDLVDDELNFIIESLYEFEKQYK